MGSAGPIFFAPANFPNPSVWRITPHAYHKNHRGEPVGAHIKVGQWAAYYSVPTATAAAQHPEAAVLIVPDVLGIWQNSQLIADQFAANGYATLLIDVFNGDPIPLNTRLDGSDKFDFMGWLAHGSTGDNPHTKEAVDPIVEAAVRFLRDDKGFKKLAAVGYCFGAKVTCCLPSIPPPPPVSRGQEG